MLNSPFEPSKVEMEAVHNFVAKLVKKLIGENFFEVLNYDLLNYCLKKDCDAWIPDGFSRQLESFPKSEQSNIRKAIISMINAN
jgi:hypothetical protein